MDSNNIATFFAIPGWSIRITLLFWVVLEFVVVGRPWVFLFKSKESISCGQTGGGDILNFILGLSLLMDRNPSLE